MKKVPINQLFEAFESSLSEYEFSKLTMSSHRRNLKYVDMAKKVNHTLIKCKVSPHTFRHSRAMHLLQAGVKLIYIRDILGHVSIQTTQIYARADSKDVRTALEQAYENIGLASPMAKSWEEDSDLRKKLKSFC